MFMIHFVSTTAVQNLLSDALDRPNRETRKNSSAQIDQMTVDSHQTKTSACRQFYGCSSGCRVEYPGST